MATSAFGFIADAFGRRPTYITYLLIAALLVWYYGFAREPWVLLVLGPFVAFFGTGYFSGFGAVAAEIFPTSIRATALGVTYNSGRLLSAIAPFMVGTMVQSRGYGAAFTMTSIFFIIAGALWLGIPETNEAASIASIAGLSSVHARRLQSCLCRALARGACSKR